MRPNKSPSARPVKTTKVTSQDLYFKCKAIQSSTTMYDSRTYHNLSTHIPIQNKQVVIKSPQKTEVPPRKGRQASPNAQTFKRSKQKIIPKLGVDRSVARKLCLDPKHNELLQRVMELEQSSLSLCKEFTALCTGMSKEIKKVNAQSQQVMADIRLLGQTLKETQSDITTLTELAEHEISLSMQIHCETIKLSPSRKSPSNKPRSNEKSTLPLRTNKPIFTNPSAKKLQKA